MRACVLLVQSKEWREFVDTMGSGSDEDDGPSTSQPQGYVGAYGTAGGKKGAKKGKAAARARAAQPAVLTQHTLEAMQDTLSELMSKMSTSGKCQNCNAVCPSIKKQGGLKLFALWSSTKALLENARKGITMRGVLDDPRVVEEMEKKAARLVAGGGSDDEKDSDMEDVKVCVCVEEGGGHCSANLWVSLA